jgi:predicted transcriptional regulator
MVYETDNSLLSLLTGEDVDLDGLSVALVVPTTIKTVVFNRSYIEIPIPEGTDVDNSIIPYMEQLGYRAGVLQISILSEEFETIMYTFSKENLSLIVNLDDGSPDSSIDNNWTVQIIGRNMTLDGFVEEETKQLLEFIGMDITLWDEAEPSYSVETIDNIVPDVETDIRSYDWGKALKEELEFLRDLSVIKGLSDGDIEDISSSLGTGLLALNDIILYDDGGWSSIWKIFQAYGLGIWPIPVVSNVLIPEKVISPIPSDEEKGLSRKRIYLILGIGISGSMAIGVAFFFSRLKTKSLKNNVNRSRIISSIQNEPGIHFRKLSRDLDLKQGVLSYHLNILEKHEIIKSVQDSNNRRFYLFDDKIVPKLTLSDIQESIIIAIYDQPGISQSGISKKLGHSKALIGYHMRILKELGIVTVEKDKGVNQCYLEESSILSVQT